MERPIPHSVPTSDNTLPLIPRPSSSRAVDVFVRDEGGIFRLSPRTRAGADFLFDQLPEIDAVSLGIIFVTRGELESLLDFAASINVTFDFTFWETL